MQQREGPLDLDKNLNKTMVVQNPGGRGPGEPGFYCDTCSRNYKDTTSYLDHINSRARTLVSLVSIHLLDSLLLVDLRALGQTTKLQRSTLEQVRARIAMLRERSKESVNARAYDLDQRLAEVKAKEKAIRDEKKAAKKAEKEKARIEIAKESAEDDEMTKMMGFGGFGSTKK